MSIGTGANAGQVIGLAVFVAVVGTFVVITVRKAEDPARMVFKWVLTAIIVAYMVFGVAPTVGQGGYAAAFSGIPLTAVCGLALAIVWRHNLAGLIAKPFGSMYDGGDVPPEHRPAYSVALARQKRGAYLEAIMEIRKQLEMFPTDFEGHILLAQIQAEDLKDLAGAEVTIQRLCAQPGHAQKNIAFALYSMADWHLKLGRDREGARRNLERIVQLLPDTEFSLAAAQRIAHLGGPEMLIDPLERKKFIVSEGDQRLGLRQGPSPVKSPTSDPNELAAEYAKHLELHPLDMDAREELAKVYAEHYGRLDLATDQLEQMIEQPNQPGRLVVRWLNLLADLQIRGGAGYETVSKTLQRIIDRAPNLAAADLARNRLGLLKLELKAGQKTASVRMGSYEQNIGLKKTPKPKPD
jgi:tetratricopeptide (TPR) repeat protein